VGLEYPFIEILQASFYLYSYFNNSGLKGIFMEEGGKAIHLRNEVGSGGRGPRVGKEMGNWTRRDFTTNKAGGRIPQTKFAEVR